MLFIGSRNALRYKLNHSFNSITPVQMEMTVHMYPTPACTPIPAAVLFRAGSTDKLLTGPKTLH